MFYSAFAGAGAFCYFACSTSGEFLRIAQTGVVLLLVPLLVTTGVAPLGQRDHLPNTLLLGVWLAAGRATITGNLLNLDGVTLPTACWPWAADPGQPLCEALDKVRLMEARNVVILSNDRALVQALSPPMRRQAHPTEACSTAAQGGQTWAWAAMRNAGGRCVCWAADGAGGSRRYR